MKISKQIRVKIKNDALARLKDQKIEEKANLHLYGEVLEVGQKLESALMEVKIDRRTAFVFVDLAPKYNWAHPCQYLLYDAETGKLHKKVDASFPPAIMERMPAKVEAFHMPVKQIDTAKLRKLKKKGIPGLTKAPTNATGNRFAILFSGHSEKRHVNDVEFLYRTLIDVYGFNAANIYVLNHDGTLNYFGAPSPIGKWPGDNTAYRMIVNGQGTRADMQATLNTLAGRIQQGDFLFIHINNHGAGPCDGAFTDYAIMEYDVNAKWIAYYVNDFIADLNVLPAFKELMVMMEQCRSGGFVDPIINHSPATRTHVAAAVNADDYSLAGYNFDPFAEDWIAGITGHYADGSALTQTVDTNNDGLISAAEAFAYADNVHTYDGTIAQYCQGRPLRYGDTPVSADSPNGCGASIFLGLIVTAPIFEPPFLGRTVPPFLGWGVPVPPSPGDPLADIIGILKEADVQKRFYKFVVDYRLALISAQLEEPGQSRLVINQLKAAKQFYRNVQKLL